MALLLLPYRGGSVLTANWSASKREGSADVVVSFQHDSENPFANHERLERVWLNITMEQFLDAIEAAHGKPFVNFTKPFDLR